jgi:hypothetical protein
MGTTGGNTVDLGRGALAAVGYSPRADSTAEFAAMLNRERVRWTEVARMYGAKPPQ